MISSHRGITRRNLLLGGAAAAALAACGGSEGDPDSDAVPSPESLPFDADLQQLGVRFGDGFAAPSIFAAGQKLRAPFVPVASDGFPVTFGEPDTLKFTVTRDGTEVHSDDAPRRRAGIGTPYYPLIFTPDTPGTYEVRSDWSNTPRPILVNERADVPIPLIGDPLPEFDTPTLDDARGVDPICTRIPEPCPFHDQTLTEALAAADVTALLVATPRYCLTDICGPVVELLTEAAPDYPKLTTVHAEVWADPVNTNAPSPQSQLADLLVEYKLDFEPSLFLADAEGTIVEALHFAFDRDELRIALDTFAS